jgi:hypothetical protein
MLLLIAPILFIISCANEERHTPLMPYGPSLESYRNDHILTKMTEGKIAVLPFSYSPQTAGSSPGAAGAGGGDKKKKGSVDVIGWKYAEEFSLYFGYLRRFDMVERLQVEKVLEEQDVDPSKMDEKMALKIGRILGAVGVVVGTAANDYINVRLVETDSGVHAWNVRVIMDKLEHEKASFRREWAANLVSTLRDATIGIRVAKRPPMLISAPPTRFILPENMKPKNVVENKAAVPNKNPAEPIKPEEPKMEWQELPGVVIVDFTIDSLAPKSGLKKGDIIERVEDTTIKDATDLLTATYYKKPGDSIVLFINRDGKLYKAIVKMVTIGRK